MEEEKDIKYDCSRGCTEERTPNGELICDYREGCCKKSVFDWMKGINDEDCKDLYEVRFKNTRKLFFRNDSGQLIRRGDIVVTESSSGHDVGIVTLEGAEVGRQMMRYRIDPSTYEFRKIYRKAKILDLERWQEAIAKEHDTMISSRQIAAELGLNMKIGDVEYQGDGTKAIFYYIADERVDFRQLIKVFAEKFRIRIEMKQIGARQEAGLIGGIGVCGRALCCSQYMSEFQSITTQAARCQDLSLNPQKLAGQCSKLKCCINYESSTYVDAQKCIPNVREGLEFEDGHAVIVKTDILGGILWFSFDPSSMTNIFPLSICDVNDILALNHRGGKAKSSYYDNSGSEKTDFVTSVGDDSISRFDESKRRKRKGKSCNSRNKCQPQRQDRRPSNGQVHSRNNHRSKGSPASVQGGRQPDGKPSGNATHGGN
ncbi:MAG: hypothetical protein LKK19_00170 [Bacteroidales bacterium]|jgi:cell fate regulator YaaT (PSP1 superfamily)|nr:hypothetical protein [Bacteroidales bacterium]MCI2121108.1 hypothetical protein [Bacteroidales bacterium]MCI2144923.1 hypothetical protein [Bacteroidales bacterium]